MKAENITPATLFHRNVAKDFIGARISSPDNSLLLLSRSSGIEAYDHDGEGIWNLRLPFEATTFAISPDGEYVALLGNGVLGIYSLLDKTLQTVEVNGKITKLDFHRNQILLGGFDRRLHCYSLSGKRVKTIDFDFLIRDFRVTPESDRIILYSQNIHLVCTDFEGEIQWETDSLRLVGPIETTKKGKNNYCLTEPEGIVQFSVPDQLFFNVHHEVPIRLYSASRNGSLLLTYNAARELVLYDKGNKAIWKKTCSHPLTFLQLSHDGDYFVTVDSDNLLSFSSMRSQDRERGNFLEISEGQEAIRERQVLWRTKPGFGGAQIRKPSQLTVSTFGNRVAVIGLDGGVYFYDQQGNGLFDMKFPVAVEEIRFSRAGNHASIYGEKRVAYIDLTSKESVLVFLEQGYRGKPVFNFPHERIFTITDNERLLVLDMKGKPVAERQLGKHFDRGITCRELGVIFYNEEQFSGFSDEGREIFTYEMKERINTILYHEGELMVTTKTGTLLLFNLNSMKGRKKRISPERTPLTLITPEPLLVSDGEAKVRLLEKDLSERKSLSFSSPDSLFYVEKGEILEITQQKSLLQCRNEKTTLWRYRSGERIREATSTLTGIYFLEEEALSYLSLSEEEAVKKDYSHFLEF